MRYLFFLVTILICSCSNTAVQTDITPNGHIHFLDEQAGRTAIAKDRVEGFFDKISKQDIELQLHRKLDLPLVEARNHYREELKKTVLPFSSREKRNIQDVFNKIEELMDRIHPDIFPDSIALIKIDPIHYGESVYYTREDAIIIPYDVLEPFHSDVFMEVMIHEIFHIYSRNQIGGKRKDLYDIIHFEERRDVLRVDGAIQKRILLNPDGIAFNWFLRDTTDDGYAMELVPVIVAKEEANEQHSFFSNLELRFFKILPLLNYDMITMEEYLTVDEIPGFDQKVGDNTDYIIHPDEILADNFILAVLSQEDETILDELSPRGKEIVEALIRILKET